MPTSAYLPKLRPVLVLIHRWVGLVMAGFLLIAGLTGTFLAWNDELDAAISPALFRAAPPAADAPQLDPLELRDRVQARYPQAWVHSVDLSMPEPGHAASFFIDGPADPKTGEHAELPNNQVFIHPATGTVLGERNWGDITQGTKNLMPFMYRLHRSLALGVIGSYAFGIVALLWTLDCFVGAYLTFPARLRGMPCRASKAGRRSWPARWVSAWKLRWNGGGHRVNFDLHRAGGLWVWAMLFVLAWSSVGFNLQEVYRPVMKLAFTFQSFTAAVPRLAHDQPVPGMAWTQAREVGRQRMAELAQAKGFTVLKERALSYDPHKGLFRYHVKSDRDVRDRGGNTIVVFDAITGASLGQYIPTGEASGDTVNLWLMSLHMAALWGIPMKVFACAMGLVVAMLAVTGVIIWLNKRKARRRSVARNAGRQPVAIGGDAAEATPARDTVA